MKQTKVPWNKELMNVFIKTANLNTFEEEVLKLYCEGTFKYIIAEKVHCSSRTVYRTLHDIEKKYDLLHKQKPELFPDKNKYKTEYNNFKGCLVASNSNIQTKMIDFNGMKFKSLEDVRKYIVKSIESMSLEEFSNIGKVHIKICVDFDVNVDKI